MKNIYLFTIIAFTFIFISCDDDDNTGAGPGDVVNEGNRVQSVEFLNNQSEDVRLIEYTYGENGIDRASYIYMDFSTKGLMNSINYIYKGGSVSGLEIIQEGIEENIILDYIKTGNTHLLTVDESIYRMVADSDKMSSVEYLESNGEYLSRKYLISESTKSESPQYSFFDYMDEQNHKYRGADYLEEGINPLYGTLLLFGTDDYDTYISSFYHVNKLPSKSYLKWVAEEDYEEIAEFDYEYDNKNRVTLIKVKADEMQEYTDYIKITYTNP
jgi:hypothetical protein